ncbi:MAG: aromatic hydrocarbon degradation protein [Helicobacteraceae bacterium]|nr:aromatic hydrocarbon degradation protein [Helicobacteraceae bacterium]
MKNGIKLALAATLALGTTSAFATNGSNLIATGAKARAMGGTSIAMAHGAESGLSNAALITSIEGTQVSFGGTIFMPNVKNTNNIGGGDVSENSAANMSVIPEVSIATKVSDSFYWGIGMWGTAGMGVDYRDGAAMAANGAQMQMVTNLQLMQFGVPLAYKTNNISFAITPLLQYGSLDINYNHAQAGNKGSGVAQDLQFGYNLGVAYEISNFTLGAVYKSQIDMDYKGVLSNTVDAFSTTGVYANDKLSTPAEIGVGVSYKMSKHTVALDYKQIKWSSCKGYEDFSWEDQNVVAVGYAYDASGWTGRLGYNYSKSPISEQTASTVNSANLSGGVQNTFNLLGFPGITESHFTLGGTYDLSDNTSVDAAYVYAPEVSNTYTTNFGTQMTTKHSQTSLSLALNYAF